MTTGCSALPCCFTFGGRSLCRSALGRCSLSVPFRYALGGGTVGSFTGSSLVDTAHGGGAAHLLGSAHGTLDLGIVLHSVIIVCGLFVRSQGALHIHGQAGAVKAAAVTADQLCHGNHHGTAIGQALGTALDGALALRGGAHQTGTIQGAQAAGKELRRAGGAAVDQADNGQVDPGLAGAGAQQGLGAVLVLSKGQRALRGDQVDALNGIVQQAAAVVAQIKHQAARAAGAQAADGVIQLAGGGGIKLADPDVAHIALHHLVIHGGGTVAGVGQVSGVLGGLAVQPGHIDGGAALAAQAGLDGIHAAHALDIGAVHSGDVVADLNAGLLGGGFIVDLDDLGIAGLIHSQLHANADQGAVLGIHQLRIGGSTEIAGVLVAGAQQVASRQAVVEGGLIDGIVIVAADIAVHLSDLVVHAFLFLHAGNGAVKQAHRHQHGNGKGNGHGQDDDADRHADRYLTVHLLPSSVRPAAS